MIFDDHGTVNGRRIRSFRRRIDQPRTFYVQWMDGDYDTLEAVRDAVLHGDLVDYADAPSRATTT